MITVHHLGLSQSERIVWLCEELELGYRLQRYDRDPISRAAPPEYKALHPIGTAPIITDGEIVLGETDAIIDYILARYGRGRLVVAPEAAAFPEYVFWLRYANGSILPSAMIGMLAGALEVPPEHPIVASFRQRGDTAFSLAEAQLRRVPYFAGAEFTAADIAMVFILTTMRRFSGRELGGFPNIRAYLARIGERPGYRRAIAKAEPGMTPHLD